MLENSLKIRGKFINKLSTKIEDLNDNFILLSKVDKKIFKKINNQIGGDGGNNVILAALKKQVEIKNQQEKLQNSLLKLSKIQEVITNFETTFKTIQQQINKIKFENIDLNGFNLQTLNVDASKNLNSVDIMKLENLLNTKDVMTYTQFKEDPDVGYLTTKIDRTDFKILFPQILINAANKFKPLLKYEDDLPDEGVQLPVEGLQVPAEGLQVPVEEPEPVPVPGGDQGDGL